MSGIFGGLIGAFPTPITNSFQSIATTTVGAGGSSAVTFSSIPSTYKHLQIRASVLITNAANIKMQVNGDTASNYSSHSLTGGGTSGSTVSAGSILSVFMYTGFWAGVSNYPQSEIIDILDYTDTNKYKTIRVLEGNSTNNNGSYGDFVGLWSGNWRSTSAVNSVTLYPTSGLFDINTKIALYGIKG
jgi:hypothetical protein